MSASVRQLNAIYNQTVMQNEELKLTRQEIKKGLEEVVTANKKLDPTYRSPESEVGAWRRVEDYNEEDYRPLVKSDYDRVSQAETRFQLLKKLDVL
jgi:hypothetical protein